MLKTALYLQGGFYLIGKDHTMDKLCNCVTAFEKLLDIQYRIIVGRKGKATELCTGFSKLDFHHLMGLGKLKDLRIATHNRGIVFDEILSGKTTYETISKSRYQNKCGIHKSPCFPDSQAWSNKSERNSRPKQNYIRSNFLHISTKTKRNKTQNQTIFAPLKKVCHSEVLFFIAVHLDV